jgi:hypothetical protein
MFRKCFKVILICKINKITKIILSILMHQVRVDNKVIISLIFNVKMIARISHTFRKDSNIILIIFGKDIIMTTIMITVVMIIWI